MKHLTLNLGCLTLAAVALTAPAESAIPLRFLVFPWGQNQSVSKGKFIVNETTATQLVANQAKFGFSSVKLDFQHNTAPVFDPLTKKSVDPEVLYGTPRSIAGHGTLSVVRPGGTEPAGIYWETTGYTPDGLANIRSYDSLSPTPAVNKAGEVIFIHSIALCRQGELSTLKFPNHTFTLSIHTTSIMTEEQLRAMLTNLGVAIPADATLDSLVALATAYTPPAPAAPAPATAPVTTPAPATPDTAALAARLDAMEKANLALSKSNIIAVATGQGKVIKLSAEQIDQTPVSVLQSVVDALPAGQVPTGSTTAGAQPPAGGGSAVVTLSAEVKRNLGLSHMKDEDITKLAAKYPAVEPA
jgi:hypothetical protein